MRRLALPLAFALVSCGGPPPSMQVADVVLLDASIRTMNPAQPEAQALAIQKGRIVFVGDDADAQRWVATSTRVLRLDGATVLPGLIDSHIHVLEGGLSCAGCTFEDEELTVAQMAPIVRDCAARTPGSDIVVVQDLNAAGFRANRQQLDTILADRPLLLWGSDGHVGWANTAALERAGIARATTDPADGRMERDSSGMPTGLLVDGALRPVTSLIPKSTPEQRERALTMMLPKLAAAGITAYMEANTSEAAVATYVDVASRNQLTARVTLALRSDGGARREEIERLVRLRQLAEAQPLLRADIIKLFADGVMEFPTQSAAMLEPYLEAGGKPGKNLGRLDYPPAPLAQFVQQADTAGFGVHVHAIGDRAVRAALDAFAEARAHGSRRSYSIAHMQLVDPADVPRFRELDVIASMQLRWAQPDNYTMDALLPYIGPQRHARLYAARSIVAGGGTIAGGSDWNVSSYNPFEAMATAISRTNPAEPKRGALNAEQVLTLREMLAAYTINAARMLKRDSEIGSLEVGKAADVVVLDRRLDDSTPVSEVRATKVVYTFAAGRMLVGPASR
jgi:predicted amidohydrolase YtcJ